MKQSIKMHVIVLLISVSCITFCIVLAKVYFTCILGISSFLTTKTSQTIATDSVAINERVTEKQKHSDEDYVYDLYQRYR